MSAAGSGLDTPANRETRKDAASPALAVVIPTRDRGDSVLRPLASLLRCQRDDLEVIVVDQSSDRRTEECLSLFRRDARLRYVRSDLHSNLRGLSRALNAGVEVSRAALVAVTGDDCDVDEDWLDVIIATFAAESRVGIVFGNVRPAEHDPLAGFVQAYRCEQPVRVGDVGRKSEIGGTSACMAFRREVFTRLHGFDAQLGVGAPLRAAEETDFAIRALQGGFWVAEQPAAGVTHHGFMTWDRLPELVDRNWFGTGAAIGKLLKRDPSNGIRVLRGLAARWWVGQVGVVATLGQGAQRRRRLVAFIRGLGAGIIRPIDRVTGHFRAVR